MARFWGHRSALSYAWLVWFSFFIVSAQAGDPVATSETDLYDGPVLAIDPGMHIGQVWGQAVDAVGRYAVTGGDDRTLRVWSLVNHELVDTIWIPVGPGNVGRIYAVAISPDGSTIAGGGWTEHIDRGA